MSKFKEKYGPWAFVSGASAGLGEGFARELAAKGMNLVLAARRLDRLEALGRELENQYGIQTRAVAIDLGSDNFLETVRQQTSDIEIGLLINNAGFTNSGDFLDNPLEKELLLVHVNIRAAMILAHHFGRAMRERKRGGIIFSASIAGHAAIPFWANYSASKAYDLLLAEALGGELARFNVDVLALCPGATRTEFEEYSGFFSSFMAMGPDKVVKQALHKLGKRRTTVVGLINLMTVMSYRLLPRPVSAWLAGKVIRDMVSH